MEPKKPTYKSTAFILIVITMLSNILAGIAQFIPAQTAIILQVILTSVFVACNAWLKQSTIQVSAEEPASIVPPPAPAGTAVYPPSFAQSQRG